jgi:hypothetical protein
MSGNRRSDRAMPELPGNRVGKVCAAKDNRAPAQRTKGQILPWLSVPAPGCRDDCLLIVAQDVRKVRPRRGRGPSTPIAQTVGGAV